MRRVLFHVAGVPIYSYAALLYVGILLGGYAQLLAARSVGLELGRTLAATMCLLMIALLGARLLFVASNWSHYRCDLRAIWRFSAGGAAVYGGLLLALPASIPILALAGLPFALFWDGASFTMIIGLIVTKVGCLLNGCCAGMPTQRWFGINLPDDRGVWRRRVPAQILESVWAMLVLAGGVLVWRRGAAPGALFLFTIGAYGAGRLLLELTREKSDDLVGRRVTQAVATTCVAISVAVFAVRWWR